MTRGCAGLALLASLLFLFACKEPVRVLSVGAQTPLEHGVLAEIAAQHIEKKLKIKVARKFSLGESQAAHNTLLAGGVDFCPESSCAATTLILRVDLSTDRGATRERLRAEYLKRFNLVWLDPLAMEASMTLAVRQEDAARHRLESIEDLAGQRDGWRIGVVRELQSRKDGYPLLMLHYRIPLRIGPVPLDSWMFRRALFDQRSVDLIVTTGSDAILAAPGVVPLHDSLGAFPPCEVSFVVRSDAAEAFPGLREALGELSGKITTSEIRDLNAQLETGRVAVVSAAEKFLQDARIP